jgi:2-methylisocitrate lyase-like PEP mutase family enzyme
VIVSGDIGLNVEQVAELGVRRISLGSGLARAAWGGFMRAAEDLAKGSFAGLSQNRSFGEINDFFRDDLKARS